MNSASVQKPLLRGTSATQCTVGESNKHMGMLEVSEDGDWNGEAIDF